MRTKIITVSVDEEAEKKFRKMAVAAYGRKKGYLGKALTEAMKEWERKKSAGGVNARALKMLEKGFNMGGIATKNRNEWHER